MQTLKPLSLGVQTLEKVIKGNYLYIDKTERIYKLITENSICFLSRPRRFGKSLLISTLKEIFTGNKELFKGLDIYNKPYDWQKYPVIRIDFSSIKPVDTQQLKKDINSILDSHYLEYKLELNEQEYYTKFKNLIQKLNEITGQRVVILIDEYDKVILDNIENIELAKQMREILKGFYGVIKSADEYIRFVFLTGVSNFSKMSIFSELNSLSDISMDNEYSDLLGITQKELELYFKPYIKRLALSEELTEEQTLEKIKTWYNGYKFSMDGISVYNPFSTLNLFKKNDFRNYWFKSGTPTFLMKIVEQFKYSVPELENIQIDADFIDTFNIENLKLVQLFFQTGYLTIKSYDKVAQKYRLDYPNLEVKRSFTKNLFSYISKKETEEITSLETRLKDSLEQENISNTIDILKIIFANIPYNIQLDYEKYYQSLFYLVFIVLGWENIQVEVFTNVGRIDCVIQTKTNIVYVIEFKLGDDKELAKQALDQIKQNKYYEKYVNTNNKIILIGIGFNYSLRNIENYVVEQRVG